MMTHLLKAIALAGVAAVLFPLAHWSTRSTDGVEMLVAPGGWLVAGLTAVRTAWLWIPLGILLGFASSKLRKHLHPGAAALVGGLIGCLLGFVVFYALRVYGRPSDAIRLRSIHWQQCD
jgi:hypothetical protein